MRNITTVLEDLHTRVEGSKNLLVLNEKQFSLYFGKCASSSNLLTCRKSNLQYEFIQLKDRYRIMYPIISIIEKISMITISNKIEFIINQIDEMNFIDKRRTYISENQFAQLLNISASTLKSYRELGLSPLFKKNGYSKFDIAEWIINNTIRVL